jgi:hypothetical protein
VDPGDAKGIAALFFAFMALHHKVHCEDSNMDPSAAKITQSVRFGNALRFWEPRRLWYNAVLIAVVMLWLLLTWPHFRGALNWLDFGRMCVLGLLANACYCAAYVAEFFMQAALPSAYWRRTRWAVWVLGILLAILIENYWIADEIYPDFSRGTTFSEVATISSSHGSNMNFPSHLAVVGFLAGCIGLFTAVASVLIFCFARKPKFAKVAACAMGIGSVVYFGLLLGYSAASREHDLMPGQEKYFCEIDCHLAYSVLDIKTRTEGDSKHYLVTLKTRFDEKTISPQRPRDAPLEPSPREVLVIDGQGHTYHPVSVAGTSLITALKPAESYTTELNFRIPKNAAGLRLLIETIPSWPDRVLIGDENSWLHKKTYFAL